MTSVAPRDLLETCDFSLFDVGQLRTTTTTKAEEGSLCSYFSSTSTLFYKTKTSPFSTAATPI